MVATSARALRGPADDRSRRVTGTVDQDLLARTEYLAAENRILKAQLTGRLKLSGADRKSAGRGFRAPEGLDPVLRPSNARQQIRSRSMSPIG